MHVALGGFRSQRVDLLGHLDHVQRGDPEDLGFAALEQRAAVRPGHHRNLGGKRPDVGDAAPVDAEVVGQDALAHQLFGQRPERGGDFLLPAGVGVGEPLEHLGPDLVGAVVALGLAGDGQRLGQLVGGHRGHRVVHVVGVVGEHRVVGGGFGGGLGEFLLRLAQLGDERLGGLQPFGDHGLRRRLRAAVDELDDVLGGLGLDHHDGHVAVLEDPAGHHHVKHRPLELLDGRERHPGAVDQGHPHPADRAGERQASQLGGRRRGVDRQHVVEVVGVQAHHGHHDLDLVAQAVDERRAQRPVNEPAGQDRVGGRPALAPEERAGDASRGVHPLLDVDGQREEVEVFLGALAGGGRREQHGLVVEVGDGGTGGLLGQPTGLEPDGAGAEAPVVDGGGRLEHALVNFSYRHGRPYSLSGFIQLFRVRQVNPRLQPGCGYGHRSKLPDRTLWVSGSHYRRPPDAGRGCLTVSRRHTPERYARIAHTAPMSRPTWPGTPSLYTAGPVRPYFTAVRQTLARAQRADAIRSRPPRRR
ncbi:hypothetical protein C1Y40_02623 [Mycobacterium talmoniae]|uniref:Uncharacterized protein n=1 Tax=Mycobacterium talmoniae TaxID=1858794 RepID=A0A2S8BKN7_9MYCO|nr:hypothetical protein C1Y40_02623 [Mycobacterium talmoniae]